MKDFTKELKALLKEDPGAPIMSPDEVLKRANTMVILTNQAPPDLLALAGPTRRAILLNYKPLMITFPDQRGVYGVGPDDIVFENHHSGRDVTEAGADETPYEKFFASAMKKFGVSSPIELNPEDTKKFFNYVDKNWDAEEESDGSKNEILPALAAVGAGLAGAGMAAGGLAKGIGSAVGGVARGVGTALGGDDETEDSNEIAPALAAVAGAAGAGAAGKVMDRISGDENESGWEDPPRLGGEPSLITPMESDDNEDVSTGKVGKKDKGSYRRAYKLALKKYQIHSADELDTPAERKGFTAYVDKLWKGGEVKETSIDIGEITPQEKARRKKATAAEKQKRGKAHATKVKKRVPGSEKSAAEKNKEKLDAQRKRNQETIKKKAAEQRQRNAEREREAASRERERDQASREREREQDNIDRDRDRFEKLKKQVDDPDDDSTDAKDKDKGGGKIKKGLGGFAAAIKQAADKEKAFVQSNASIPEGVKKSSGVSKKARGAVGFAKHARKGTGAKRQFQKGVRQAGKKQARNEVSPPDRKHQVKGIKKHMAQKKGKDKIPKTYVDKKTGKRKETNPWALAWAQYDKYGVPSRIEKD